jgi:serine/threonine-protein kinase
MVPTPPTGGPKPGRALAARALIDRRFRVLRPLGRGGTCDIFEGIDEASRGRVALQVVRHDVDEPDLSRRLEQEAQAQARVSHPNVASYVHAGLHEGRPYLVMELLAGPSLHRVVREQGQLSAAMAFMHTWHLLQGLHAAHVEGVLHRDIKPANVIVEPVPGSGVSRIVLIDFGFAALQGMPRLTREGTVVGSPSYMAPERLMGDALDVSSDLYAIGATLFELLTGQPPFTGETAQILREVVRKPPPTLRERGVQVPLAVEAFVRRALAKRRDERFVSAEEMALALTAASTMSRQDR